MQFVEQSRLVFLQKPDIFEAFLNNKTFLCLSNQLFYIVPVIASHSDLFLHHVGVVSNDSGCFSVGEWTPKTHLTSVLLT